jgi:hypothetical protein
LLACSGIAAVQDASRGQASSIQNPPATSVAPPSAEPNQDLFGAHIQYSMTLLATSAREHRWPVRVLLYGQSIIGNSALTDLLSTYLYQQFPFADISLENRAIGGFEADRLVRTSIHDLYPDYPDLLIFHVYGGQRTGDLERIISNVRRYTTSDIVLFNDHQQASAPISESSAAFFRYLAAKYDCELVDVSTEWPRYLKEHALQPSQLLKDGVHPNSDGYAILAQMIERHLRYNPLFSDPWATRIRRYEAKRPLVEGVNDEITLSGPGWALDNEGVIGSRVEGRLRLAFDGNRVDLIAAHTNLPSGGTARVLIDGKPPSQISAAYAITRPSAGPGTWFPAIKRISHLSPLLLENWTLRIDRINADATDFDFDVVGSKTGPDGAGSSKQLFKSKSGRVVIEPQDWMFADIMKIFKQADPPPVGFTVQWSVVPMFTDTYAAPVTEDAAKVYQTTLVQGISNAHHVLELIPNGDGPVPVEAIQIYHPPLQ